MQRLSLARGTWQRATCCAHTRRWAHQVHAPLLQKKFVHYPAIFPALDKKWQAKWKADKQKTVGHEHMRPSEGKAYILPMFPYPSGTLHLGHLRVYTISDVLARFKQLQGYQVIHPIGWDAFGLPAENAALERGIHPEKWTLKNIEAMKEQMEAMGGRWDWHREIRTCDPEFYKHTQRIFLMLHERGLAYQAESLVNYDPVDRTVLANEQVDANGCSWRSGAKVEKKMLKQWFLKIKEYQKPLLYDLDVLAKDGNWPERVLAMQRNWIGRSSGRKIPFGVRTKSGNKAVEVFTTRADTLFGVQYLALSLTHPIVKECAEKDEALRAFIDRAGQLSPDSKEGYLLHNVTASNPISKIQEGLAQDIPVYVAPYVLADYGSGAVMGVPGHDTRDHAFWRENAGDSPIRKVISAEASLPSESLLPGSEADKPMTEKGFIASDIPEFGGLPSDEAFLKIAGRLRHAGVLATKTENWRLRDWLISRQRYWGTPIPIVHCGTCGPVPVPVADLPVELPNLPDEYFQGKTGNPLAEDPNWKKTRCPRCGSAAERETDTMDTFMDSSWYFFRFLSPDLTSGPVNPQKADASMPVDIYIGGVEHAILHLLYARFISKFLATTEYWPSGSLHNGEPFKKLVTQGMVHGKTYSDPNTGRFLKPDEVDLSNPPEPVIIASGQTPNVSFEKMSKSKYNGVDPGKTIARHGADVTRAHMLFQAPVGDVLEWDESKITGVERWLTRVLRLCKAPFIPPTVMTHFAPMQDIDAQLPDILFHYRTKKQGGDSLIKPVILSPTDDQLLSVLKNEEQILWTKTQEIIASVTKAYVQTISLNTIISDLMTLTNTIWHTPHTSKNASFLQYHALIHLLRMLAPIAPATAEEGWEMLHMRTNVLIANQLSHPLRHSKNNPLPSIFTFGFPEADLDIIPRLTSQTLCVFMLDGKKKFTVNIPRVPADMQKLQNDNIRDYVLQQLLETGEGRLWLAPVEGKLWVLSKEAEGDDACRFVPRGWNVIVPADGRIVNVASPKVKKGKKVEKVVFGSKEKVKNARGMKWGSG